MYKIVKSVIESRNYELKDIVGKIDKRCLEGSITEDERDELIALAREKAEPKNSYAPLQNQINTLFENIKELAGEILALKNGGTFPEEPTEEYPEYVQPTGAHDAYKVGDKITYKGKKYECLKDGCVWTPDDYPIGWKLVEETETTE